MVQNVFYLHDNLPYMPKQKRKEGLNIYPKLIPKDVHDIILDEQTLVKKSRPGSFNKCQAIYKIIRDYKNLVNAKKSLQ